MTSNDNAKVRTSDRMLDRRSLLLGSTSVAGPSALATAGAGKPVAINRFIARRPILAFGNSDGDLQMLQWGAAGNGARFMGIVHHTDGERAWD
jgi:hypothetical protein